MIADLEQYPFLRAVSERIRGGITLDFEWPLTHAPEWARTEGINVISQIPGFENVLGAVAIVVYAHPNCQFRETYDDWTWRAEVDVFTPSNI